MVTLTWDRFRWSEGGEYSMPNKIYARQGPIWDLWVWVKGFMLYPHVPLDLKQVSSSYRFLILGHNTQLHIIFRHYSLLQEGWIIGMILQKGLYCFLNLTENYSNQQLLWCSFQSFFKQKWQTLRFQLLKREDCMLFFVMYDGKLNICGFWTSVR